MNLSWKVLLVFSGIFLAGAVTGGVAGIHWSRTNKPPHETARNPVEQFRRSHMSNIEKRLDLTAEQREKIKPAIAKAGEAFHKLRKLTVQQTDEILEQMNNEVAKFLTPEQRAKFEDMRQHQKERMKALMQGGRGMQPPADGAHRPNPHEPPSAPSKPEAHP